MVIVDTSVLIDFMAGRRNLQTIWLREHADSQLIGITSLVLTEVLQGIRTEETFQETLAILSEFQFFEANSQELAVEAARNYRGLRKSGVTIRNTIDVLTATFCIQEGHALLHNDRDFDPFENLLGLEVLHPPAFD